MRHRPFSLMCVFVAPHLHLILYLLPVLVRDRPLCLTCHSVLLRSVFLATLGPCSARFERHARFPTALINQC